MPSLNTKLASAPNTTSNYVLKATSSTTIGNSLIFDNGTSVGIGTATPFAIADTNLTVNGTTSSAIQLGFNGTRYGQFYTDSGEVRLSAVANLPLTFYSNNLERMRITSAGRVAIGRTVPGTALSVAGQSEQWQLAVSTDTGAGAVIGSPSANVLAFGDWSGTERMRITSGGELLINATTNGAPNLGYQLGVRGTNANSLISIALANQTLSTEGCYIGLDGTIGYIHMIDNKPWTFSTNNTERMRITSGGNVSIGSTTDSGFRLYAKGTNGLYVEGGTSSSNSALLINNSAGDTQYFRVRGDGYLFSTPTYNNTWAGFSANMYIASDGSFGRTTPSSGRYKDNINEWNGKGLETILALKPKTFKYKKEYCETADIDFLGLIAEEVAEVSPYLAQYEKPDRTGLVENVRYDIIVVPLIAAIQEQQAMIEAQQQQINQLINK